MISFIVFLILTAGCFSGLFFDVSESAKALLLLGLIIGVPATWMMWVDRLGCYGRIGGGPDD